MFARALATNERGLRMRLLSAGLRREPDFLIIGVQKGGTTSLYSYLCRHPQVVPATRVEVHYFDLAYDRGWWWYKSHFPVRGIPGLVLTGEASPYYIFHPAVPERVHRHLPRVKLIALLRNPVDRAYSHYQHVRRNGRESLSFEEAIEREAERTRGEAERVRCLPGTQSAAHRRYSYIARGHYAEQLSEWLKFFPREQLLVLRSEDMFTDPQAVCSGVWDFLGLARFEADSYPVYNPGGYRSGMTSEVRRRLTEHFEPHNRRLVDMLGWDRSWDE